MASIEQIINNSYDYATNILGSAVQNVSSAMSAAQGYVLLEPRDLNVDLEEIPDNIEEEFRPEEFTDNYVAPSDDDIDLPSFVDYYLPERPDYADAPAPLDASGLFNIERPAFDIPSLAASDPDIDTNIAVPDAPETIYPDAPESSDSLVAPVITAPTFDKNFEGNTPDPTTDLVADFEAKYANILPEAREAIEGYADSFITKYNPRFFDAMETLESQINTALTSDSAISDGVEQQIFNRARDRAADEERSVRDEYTGFHARRGFAIPPGAMAGGIGRAREATSRQISGAAANVAIERARLELQHKQFCLQLSTSIRSTMVGYALQYHGNLVQINGQAIEYARQCGAFAAEVFNQHLQVYNAQLQLYQTEASVYATRLESAFAELRSFEAQIEAERLKSEVDANRIRIYEAKINAERSKVDTYIAQLQGVNQLLEKERFKIDIFESQIRAYAARVQGKEAEYGAYRAAIQGDSEKVRGYQAQIQAYSAEIDATKSKVDAERSYSQSITDWNRLLMEQFNTSVRKYETEIGAESTRYRSSVEGYNLALQRYQTNLNGRLEVLRSRRDQERFNLTAAVEQFRGDVDTMHKQADIFMSRNSALTNAALSGADVLKGIGAAAVSVNNTMLTSEEES